jgi:hypothetical protein
MSTELSTGRRSKGGQKKRFKDALKANLKQCNINYNAWESLADDRSTWRLAVHAGVDSFEDNRISSCQESRQRRKDSQSAALTTNTPSPFICHHCHRSFRAQIGLISHLCNHSG